MEHSILLSELTLSALRVDKLSSATAFNKDRLLDLLIYDDGHEEIRKPVRNRI
jgi:hypothetical protein